MKTSLRGNVKSEHVRSAKASKQKTDHLTFHAFVSVILTSLALGQEFEPGITVLCTDCNTTTSS